MVENTTGALKYTVNITNISSIAMLLHAETGDVMAQCLLGSQTLLTSERDVLFFFENCSMNSAKDLSALGSDRRCTTLKIVARMVLQTFVKIFALEVGRDTNNAPSYNLLPYFLPCYYFSSVSSKHANALTFSNLRGSIFPKS